LLASIVAFLGFLVFSRLFGFHANLSWLNSTWLGPGGDLTPSSHRGRALILIQDKPATIFTIAKTGAMLSASGRNAPEKMRP